MASARTARPHSSYHVFRPNRAAPGIDPKRFVVRGFLALATFFGLVVVGALLVALSPTLSRSLTAFFIGSQKGAIPWNGTDPVNMVIAGLDVRPGDSANGRTDSLMVASVDPRNGSIRMLSIPRDLWVNIPGYGPDRINDAYAIGGTNLLIQTVEGVVNMPIRYYTIIKFTGFQKVIDALGGVTIDVPKTIWDPTYPAFKGFGYAPLYLKRGVHHMSGALALKYVRERHAFALGDLERNIAQQQLLSALKSQVLTPHTLFNLPVILSALRDAVSTNFPFDDLTYLFRVAMTASSEHRYLNYNDGAVSNWVTPGGADVLLPNWPRIHWIARQTFRNNRLGSAPVAVLNGSGTSGEAGALAHWLRASGFRVTTVANADRPNYAHSETILNTSSSGGGGFVARMLADQMRTRVNALSVSGISAPVVVIVGQDWNSPIQS